LSVVALAGAAAGGWALGGRALRPLAGLRATAAEVAVDSDASRRVPASTGATEVDGLATTLNEMLARLQTALGGERAAAVSAREFAANAAHELRTPMTALSANVDVLARPDLTSDVATEVLDDIRSDARRLAEVLGGLEQLARGELHPVSAAQAVDLAELVDAAVAEASRRHPDASFSLAIADRPGGETSAGPTDSGSCAPTCSTTPPATVGPHPAQRRLSTLPSPRGPMTWS
jgi:two-component system sensor histidine kinase PrrB